MTVPQQPAVPRSDRTTLFGVLGIISAFCCPILGIVFGFLSLGESKKARKSPTLAYIAITLCIVTAITGGIVGAVTSR